ncbi:MAG: hypothetical protein DMF29_06010 [Verrucomicrobia bacterium]|nr:MAG: hypothetical protein DMF29_06010 [Verrucomicrobiota bacterium]
MNSKLFAALTGVVIIFTTHGLAVEVTEPAGAEHGYPGLCDINGKKLADGEFRQWMDEGRLHVVITYKFPDGQFFEENAVFRQEPELIQEKWSWKELKNEKPQREFAADFLAGTASAHILKDNKDVTDKIDIVPGQTFAGFGFTIALGNLRPRLLKGEQIELKAVGFSPIPTLKPQVVTVKVSHAGLDKMKMSGRFLHGDNFVIHPEVPVIAKLFIKVPDTHIWLTNPKPAGFLRWEGPIVLPNDPMIRVDLVSDHFGGPAEAVEAKKQ